MANKTVKITKKPTLKVKGLGAPYVSSGHAFSAIWAVPNDLVKSSSSKRATTLGVKWTLGMQKTPNTSSASVNKSTTSSEIDLDRCICGWKSRKQYNRNSFYPLASDNKLTSLSISVRGNNKKGKGKWATQSRTFAVPEPPTIDEISLNTANGVLTTTIRAAETVDGLEYKERYDTGYKRTVYTSSGSETTSMQYFTGTEATVTYDAVAYKGLTDDNYIKVTWEAISRGYAGDSTPATRNIYLAYPAAPTIQGVDVTNVSGSGDGRVTVKINTNQSETHPVEGVKLQYAKNTDYTEPSQVPDSAFEDSGIEDNGDCTALTMPVSLFEQERGKHSWVRVKSYNLDESVLYKYSDYREVKDLFEEAPSAGSADVDVLSVESGEDGESAVVTLGWNKDGTDEFTGTELSWSDDSNSWKSTKDPDHYEFTWSDGQLTDSSVTPAVTYHDSAKITIMDLTRDKMYYVKARRYLEGDTTTYGAYSKQDAHVTPTNAPSKVVPRCPQAIADGEPLGVYWSFGGGGLQTKWRISDGQHNLADGEGSIGFAQIDAKTISIYKVNGKITFKVWVTTGGGEKDSDEVTVNIIPKPTLSIANLPDPLTTNALTFRATCSRDCDLAVTVTSRGKTGQTPQGIKNQVAGDTIYSELIEHIPWNNNVATIALPQGLDFWDGGDYDISITAIDREYKLRSEELKSKFTVGWARKAVNPDDFVTVTPLNDYVDGEHRQAVKITLTPPTGSDASDSYEIYRMDGLNAHLIGRDLPLTLEVIDEYAPIGGSARRISATTENPSEEGWYEYDSTTSTYIATDDETVVASKDYYECDELFYRVAIRTPDGDADFTDKPYAYPSDNIRVDWSGGSLELPYGNTVGDSYKKDVEFRRHMDGTIDGYWNEGVERTGSYSSNVIQLIQPNEINLARELARYAGAVFLRTPNGSAYTADVQVTDLSVKNKAVTAIALDATEIELTEEFMLPSEDEE